MNGEKDYTDKEVEYIFNKTMTVNEKEVIENCKNSMEIISKATSREHHPWVNDKEDEEEKIKTEEKEEAEKQETEYDKMIKELKKKTPTNDTKSKVGDK